MERRLLLRATFFLVALVFSGGLAGCGQSGSNQQAVITPDSQVWRLAAVVHAGNSEPLPELTNNNAVSLAAGGMVTTNSQGEAKVVIADCLTLYIFQNGNLRRSTCRKSDSTSGLGVCSTDGMVDVINDCLSQIDIQTPSSSAASDSTWFSVIYLPQEQLSLVQLYEGTVTVHAVIDANTGEMTPDSQRLVGPGLWFTRPGADAPMINGIRGREPQPLEVWPVLRQGLIERYPMLDQWMRTAREMPGVPGANFPEILVLKPGTITSRFIGQLWADDRIRRAMISGVDWKDIVVRNWPEFDIQPSLQLSDTTIDDARKTDFNRDEALRLMTEADFWQRAPSILVAAIEEDKAAVQFAYELQRSLTDLDIQVEVRFVSPAQFEEMQKMDANTDSPFILVRTSGEAFGK